jgi:Arc/MetJ family transcription regulator
MARTTLDLDEKLIEDLMRETAAPTKKAAIEDAVRERLNAVRREKLLARLGTGFLDMTLADLEKLRGKPRIG